MSSGDQVSENKTTVRRMLSKLNEGDVDGLIENLAPDYVRHCQAMPPELRELHGPEAMREWLISNQETFPDYHEEIEFLMGEGDFISWRSRGRGTQKGPFGPFPATNKQMEVVIIGVHRFEDGLVAETWTSWDNLAVLTQLGLLEM